MLTEYLDNVDVVIEYHNNYVNDGDKFGKITIAENVTGGWEITLDKEDAAKLCNILKKHLE